MVIRRDYFSPEEKDLYLSLFSDAKRQFNTYLDQGTILNSTCPLTEVFFYFNHVSIRLFKHFQLVLVSVPALVVSHSLLMVYFSDVG